MRRKECNPLPKKTKVAKGLFKTHGKPSKGEKFPWKRGENPNRTNGQR